MEDIAVFRHTPDDGPGYLDRFLLREGVSYRLVCVDEGEAVPERLGDLRGLVFMGGPQSANDVLPWIPHALRLIREATDRDVPVLGHCLGGQLMARALGGTVGPSPAREIGWLPVRQVQGHAAGNWFRGLPAEFTVFQWHWETFSVPPGASLVLTGDACPNQGFVLGKGLALQCHIEMTAEMVREWVADPGDALAVRGPTVQSAEAILAGLDERLECLHRVADAVYRGWLRGVR